MALQKSKTMTNGATGNYWKITSVQIDKNKLEATWVLSLYTDKAHADNGSPSLGYSYNFKQTFTKAQLAVDTTALGYTTIKAQIAAPAKNKFTGGIQKQPYIDLTGVTDV